MDQRPGARLRQFFATVPVPCPYLPGSAEQKLVVELKGHEAPALYDRLSRAGFRRSHGIAYRPACRGCDACVPVRIDATRFRPTRSLKRVARRGADLEAVFRPPTATREQYDLFHRYVTVRHGASEMARMSFADYRAMVEETAVATALVEFRDGDGTLAAGCLIDCVDDGFSAVYSFFAPERHADSLGTCVILELIEEARRRDLPHVYLGYWIEDSPTMDYKRRFPALEGLIAGRWQPLAPDED